VLLTLCSIGCLSAEAHLYCFFGSSGSFGGSIRYLQQQRNCIQHLLPLLLPLLRPCNLLQ
jgi:hypothetical protein